ncbi:TIR domain-containing protein [Paractinoplanes toevensis]|uniref:TIR domain-containing protein n=1 Tax=Paractinoplanes toevensis TaxID=571911 RepID=A0A919T814_9ACTN|nr:TIR domain-containing protein [Actinoplanes toevensis]GIM89776.1 hypothetical protein Ato02nite_015690 [Actinoplanes toevensis]
MERAADGEFDAFISYSHAVDGSLAPALQRALEDLTRPWYRRRALRVFRDRTNLAAAPGLWPAIEAALVRSRYFVLLASPEAAGSAWVQREVAWWLSNREPATLLIALTGGDLRWGLDHVVESGPDCALPGLLTGAYSGEPLWVDLRWARTEPVLSARDSRLLDAAATFAAALHGVPKDDLVGLDLARHRGVLRLTRLVIAVLTVLLVAAATGGVLAVRQRDAAVEQTALAESRTLAMAAQSVAATRVDTAMLLSAQAMRRDPSLRTQSALFAAVTASPHLVRFVPQPAEVTGVAFAETGDIVMGRADGSVSRLDRSASAEEFLGGAGSSPIAVVAVSADGGSVVAADQAGTVRLWSGTTLKWSVPGQPAPVAAAIAPDRRTIAIATTGGADILAMDSGHRRARIAGDGHPRFGIDGEIAAVGFLGDDLVQVGYERGRAEIWRLAARPRRTDVREGPMPQDATTGSAWSAGGRSFYWMIYGAGHGYVPRLDAAVSFRSPVLASQVVAVDETGRRVAVRFGRSIYTVEAGGATEELPGFADATSLTFSPDGRRLLATGAGTAILFDLDRWGRLTTALPDQVGDYACKACGVELAVHPHGRATVWLDGNTLRCRPADGRVRAVPLRYVIDLAFTADGKYLVSATDDVLEVLPAPNGCPPPRVRSPRSIQVRAFGVRPVTGSIVLVWSGNEDEPALVDVATGKVLRKLRLPAGADGVRKAAVDPALNMIAVAADTGAIHWFDMTSGNRTATAEATGTIAPGVLEFQPGTGLLAVSAENSVELWDPHRGLLGRLSGAANQLHFTADGRMLAGLTDGDRLRIWDMPSRTLLGEVAALPDTPSEGFDTKARDPAFAGTANGPGDRWWIAAPGARPTGWTINPAEWATTACTWPNRTLAPTEWRQLVGTDPPADLSCSS